MQYPIHNILHQAVLLAPFPVQQLTYLGRGMSGLAMTQRSATGFLKINAIN
jgi:hypothetical protein